MPNYLLKFQFEKITPDNVEKWRTYFDQQWQLYSDLKGLALHPCIYQYRYHGNIDKILLLLNGQVRLADGIKKIFVVDAITLDNLPKILSFLMYIGPIIGNFFDPIRNANLTMDCEPEKYSGGLYIASVSSNDQVIMSMVVAPTPSKKAQFHKFIFKSLSFLLYRKMNDISPPGELSLVLHSFAAKEMGAEYIVSRPLRIMDSIMKTVGFIECTEEVAETLFGQVDYEYLNRYGLPKVGLNDETYPMIYHKNDLEIQKIYQAKLSTILDQPILTSGSTFFQAPSSAEGASKECTSSASTV